MANRNHHLIWIACGYCGLKTQVPPSRLKQGKGFYCRKQCQTLGLAKKRAAEFAKHFWERVDTSGGPDACHPWTGSLNDQDYGHVTHPDFDSPQRTNRVAYELTHGPLCPGLWALHSCDNPICCNPKHLFAGTPKNNTDDMYAKGRAKPAGKHVPRRILKIAVG